MRPARLLILLPFLLCACAQVADISGGEIDTVPPELIAAEPAHLSTGFSGDRIMLAFNERIQLDRVRDRLLISPPLATFPEVIQTGSRTVTIKLNAPLSPNTTYSISIGEAIKDLTEGNSAAGLAHVFSTGSYVDSSRIAGHVINAFTGRPEKDVLVMIHHQNDTGSVRTARPAFTTRTTVNGSFLLDHLPAGSFKIHALRDQNANYRFDLPNEEIAFIDGPVTSQVPSDSLIVHSLRLFKEAGAIQQIRETQVTADGALQIILQRPAETISVADIARTGGTLKWLQEWGIARDTVKLWPTDTTQINLGKYQITTEEGVIDTIVFRRKQPMPFFVDLRASMEETSTDPVIVVHASRPIASVDTALFQLLKDSVPLDRSLSLDRSDRRKLLIDAPLSAGDRATLQILPGAVTDIYGMNNDTLITGIGRAAEESTGAVRIDLQIDPEHSGPFLLHLLDPQGRMIKSSTVTDPSVQISWDRLMPGRAMLRLIEDSNNNGRWDPGNLDRQLQPEMVWDHPEGLNIRAAWDIGIEWRISDRPDPEPDEP